MAGIGIFPPPGRGRGPLVEWEGANGGFRLTHRSIHQHSASHSIIIPSHKLVPHTFPRLAHPGEHHRRPPYLINALGRVEILILPLPSRIRTAMTEFTAVWSYNYIHISRSVTKDLQDFQTACCPLSSGNILPDPDVQQKLPFSPLQTVPSALQIASLCQG